MNGATTISIHDRTQAGADGNDDPALALVIAWSAVEPHRIGEVALCPPGAPRVLGRDAVGDAALEFVRQRPGAVEPGGPLDGPGISREQLRVGAHRDALAVERVGRCPMAVNGEPTDRSVLCPGDTLLLRGQLLLQCVRRPLALPALHDFHPACAGPFGAPDELGMIGETPVMWRLRDRLAFVAKVDGHVLIVGETGTGKELAARALHALSRRRAGAMVSRNAATIPSGIADAELFGNVKNYPNPGMPDRAGLVGEADGGTLFLDEVAELAPDLQAHLLRVLDAEGEYHRLGDAHGRRSDLRVIGATNRDPTELKHDLLARLSLRIELPPLSQRREDIPLLCAHLLARAAERSGDVLERFRAPNGAIAVKPTLVEALLRRPLAGNVRELESLLWEAVAASADAAVAAPRHWAEEDGGQADIADGHGPEPVAQRQSEPSPETILAAVTEAQGNLARAARALGLPSRYALYRLLKKHGIHVSALRE